METKFQIFAPHKEAAAAIASKPVMARRVFDELLPELRGRAFTITGIEGANVLQRVRDSIAALPMGSPSGEAITWDTQKRLIVEELDPYLGDGAEARAELLLRIHGFQAFQSANWNLAQEDEDTTHLQYLATEDDRVRPTHLALNGLVLPKDDPFWQDHFPPWEWGCRCRTRAMNPDLVDAERAADEERNPEDRNVIEGPALKQLRDGTLLRNGQRYDVTAPADRADGGDSAYQWNPNNLKIPLEELKSRYDRDAWEAFEVFARGTALPEMKTSLWAWLSGK